MDNKYLPIGTVCTVKGNTKKVMITGFLKTSYNGNLKQFDYIGCVYPEGNLLNDRQIAFDHVDIEKIDFMGYSTELHNNLNSILNSNSINSNTITSTTSSSFIFDENGVVVFDNTVKNIEVDANSNNTIVENPFNRQYNPETNLKINTNTSSFKFDENGVVIEDNTVADLNSKIDSIYVFDENGFVIEDRSKVSESMEEVVEVSTQPYKFDENGVVIEDTSVQVQPSEEVEDVEIGNAKYQFDENGVVIADNDSTNKVEDVDNSTQLYKFDENGTVIEDASIQDKSSIKEEGTEVGKSKYQFDENGVVIAEDM